MLWDLWQECICLFYQFKCGCFLNCFICKSHLTSFWITLRTDPCVAVYTTVHLWEEGNSAVSYVAILVWICRKEVQTWYVIDKEMFVEKWDDLLMWFENKNGSHGSDFNELVSPVSWYAKEVNGRMRPWAIDFWSCRWTPLVARTLYGDFSHWPTF